MAETVVGGRNISKNKHRRKERNKKRKKEI